MSKEDKLVFGVLGDYYRSLLTERQAEFLRLYYDRDMSLSEIACEFEISRQAVADILRRAEKQLAGYESKLGLMRDDTLSLRDNKNERV